MCKGHPREGMEGLGQVWGPWVTYLSSQLGKQPPELPDFLTLIGLDIGVMGSWGLQREKISEQVRGGAVQT